MAPSIVILLPMKCPNASSSAGATLIRVEALKLSPAREARELRSSTDVAPAESHWVTAESWTRDVFRGPPSAPAAPPELEFRSNLIVNGAPAVTDSDVDVVFENLAQIACSSLNRGHEKGRCRRNTAVWNQIDDQELALSVPWMPSAELRCQVRWRPADR